MDWLSGKKTYIVAIIGVIMTGLLGTGTISQDQYNMIMGLLGALGLATLRAGVTKSGQHDYGLAGSIGIRRD